MNIFTSLKDLQQRHASYAAEADTLQQTTQINVSLATCSIAAGARDTYAAIEVWAQAAERAGSTDLDAVIGALNSNTFTTVLGDITFDGNGDILQPAYVWYEWSGGTYGEIN